jgi:hypothetical protein
MRRFVLTACLLVPGCIDTGLDEVSVPLSVRGTEIDGPVTGRDDVPVEIDQASLAFGPLYLCAGRQAGELCETAQLEWLDSIVVEPLTTGPVEAGELNGLTGTVRSWMYDLGITSLLTQPDPVVLPAAEALGGASIVVSGSAVAQDVTIRFQTALAIQQEDDTEIGVPVVRSAPADAMDHDVETDEAGLLLVFDAHDWVTDIDFVALLDDDACQTIVDQECDGVVELDADSQGGRSIRNRVVAGSPPTFIWGHAP